jgi:hypothetical protein
VSSASISYPHNLHEASPRYRAISYHQRYRMKFEHTFGIQIWVDFGSRSTRNRAESLQKKRLMVWIGDISIWNDMLTSTV